MSLPTTAVQLRAELEALVPTRCKRRDEICPMLAGSIVLWTMGFDRLAPETQAAEADRAIRVFEGVEEGCRLGVALASSFGGQILKCRQGELCGGFGGPDDRLDVFLLGD